MLRFSAHAVQRCQERLWPALDQTGIERELRRLTRNAPIVPTPPEWTHPGEHQAGWVMLGDDACLVLERMGRDLVAVTCLTRGGIGDELRAARNRRRKLIKARRRHAKTRQRRERAGRPSPPPVPDVEAAA